jgi:hypothetical protein
MSEEGFFKRWARLKTTGASQTEVAAPVRAGAAAPDAHAAPAVPARAEAPDALPSAPALPTLEDAARITPDADFSAFVGQGVDKSVQRLALKKLFTDPHFNAMDGLDMYMSDYNKASPLTPLMLASLQHAQGLVARLLDDQRKEAEALAEASQGNTKEAPVIEAPPTTEQGTA